MKKIIALFIFVFAIVTNVSAQAQVIHCKKTEKKTYFRVSQKGEKDTYYSAFNPKKNEAADFYGEKDNYYKSGYDKIKAPEEVYIIEGEDTSIEYEDSQNNINTGKKEKQGGIRWSRNSATYTPRLQFKTGRVIPDVKDISARAIKNVSTSSDLEVGNCYKLLEVTRAEDQSLIGCYVICQVVESRKSNILGSEGRLTLRPICIEKLDGTQIRLQPTDIQRRGLNRTNVKCWTSFLVIPLFFPGSRAEIKQGESIKLRLE